MSLIDLLKTATDLPAAWSSRELARVGTACVKVLRMDELPLAEEAHPTTEALIVLDGRLELVVEGTEVPVGPGEMYVLPAGTKHAVSAGSGGTLMIVEVPEE
ncbi:cupin domain-containing protein [Actinomadura hibisca]|uniref:cupin domain-containing protein n=1 Tax=Actinomadura hibisca TaxID=68565 RepID=UPI00082D2AFF|nr:cupin domain-containing protein [Actinomadura hibisca]